MAKQEFRDLLVSLNGGGVRATPGFWVAALWKKVMGTVVLEVGGDRTGTTRVYAHQDPATGKVGVVVINLDSEAQAVDLAVGPGNTASAGE